MLPVVTSSHVANLLNFITGSCCLIDSYPTILHNAMMPIILLFYINKWHPNASNGPSLCKQHPAMPMVSSAWSRGKSCPAPTDPVVNPTVALITTRQSISPRELQDAMAISCCFRNSPLVNFWSGPAGAPCRRESRLKAAPAARLFAMIR
jgi:hypothetical protein